MAVEILLSIVGFATHVYRLIDRSSRESTSSQSIKDNPRIYQPYMASNALGFIVSISWSFFTGLGIFVLPLTVWKHWKRRSVRNLG